MIHLNNTRPHIRIQASETLHRMQAARRSIGALTPLPFALYLLSLAYLADAPTYLISND
jgi:hypothetical protein